MNTEQSTYKSRKFILTVISLCLVTLLTFASAWFPVLPTVMPTFTGGILGILSLYFVGNVSNKYVVNKTLQPCTTEEKDNTTKENEV